ncbi:MAG: cation:proton antiporter [Betaproteobacteria bacterium]|nr:cation:proton antiporter [Betaproteobacteria bacterium]MBU6512267.1 cation:proton antiporter [Betaproteobacteria bacterium]MDE1956181.1 cation:proton antiporter [Betaproteobacteria bacterium]MDE2152445.1 cation:proton antiporter [Betaproteobacteria bacterium]
MSATAVLTLLAATVLLVPLFKRLGLGSLLGYLIAGIAVGPYGLHVDSQPQAVLHTAELGVTLLMFLIGLELKPTRLWALRRQVFGLGLLQMAGVALPVAALALLAGLALPGAALVGVALAMSSTAYVLPLLAERRELTTRQGREAFAILLFQDVSVIPILALLSVVGGAGRAPGWAALAALGLLAVAGRPVLATMFRYVTRFGRGNRELFAAAALLGAVGIAVALNAVGLSASLGAFLAGVLLADSEFRHELEAAIEPFESLLLGLFFIAVGMGIPLALLAAHPLLIGGLGAGIVLLKALSLYAVRRATGGEPAVARSLAVLLACGGEFAFVLFAAARGSLLAPETADLLTAAVALSLALAPLAVIAHDRLLLPWARSREAPPFSPIDEPGRPVVIAGFGRVGQVVGRMLNARGVPFTALDASAEQVDFVRRFGNTIYYGDASRLPLLRAAGVEAARLFVLAVDDVEASVKIAELMRMHFPEVPVLARARNRTHMMRLRELGIQQVMRETWGSSVDMGKHALQLVEPALDVEAFATVFAQHDLRLLDRQQAVYHDQAALIALSRQAGAELEDILQNDARLRMRAAQVPAQEQAPVAGVD